MYLLKGKKCLITGASSGLGLELTKLAIQEGAEVIMLCRDEVKCKELVRDLLKRYPNSKLQYELADFSSLKSVNNFISTFREKHTTLDILINNAALLKAKITKTVDGFESMFQVNYLVPFILTNSLLSLLKNSKFSQIINITLPPEKLRLDFEDLQSLHKFKSVKNMFKTKLCLFLFSMELAERLSVEDTNIKVLTGIPSKKPFKTNLGREMPSFIKLVMSLISLKTEEVVKNILHIVTEESIKSGYVFNALNKVNLNSYWQNGEIRRRLWINTENLLNEQNEN
jgi:NAD(P)-dependent dehydrogenase (short-subunit alcohol dehydrogenase family)